MWHITITGVKCALCFEQGKQKCNSCAWGSTHGSLLALDESWSCQGICAHTCRITACYSLKTVVAVQWTVQQSLQAQRSSPAVCALSMEKKHREKWKSWVFLLPFLKQNLPSPFITSRQELTLPAYTFQELQLAILINSYSRFNEQMWGRRSAQTEERHANVKLAFSERLRRHRDAGKEGAWAVPSELGRKTCLSLNKFQVFWKQGLGPIFQSRSTVLLSTWNWNQGLMHVRQVSSTELYIRTFIYW